MTYKYYLLIFLLISKFSFAQPSAIDSLQVLIEQSEEDTTKIQLMLDLSTKFYASEPDKTISISKEAYDLSNLIDYKWGVGYSLKSIGNGKYFKGDNAEALVYWGLAKRLFEEINDMEGVANMLSNMGAVYSDQGLNLKALELFLEALEIAEVEQDSLRIATVTQNIGAVQEANNNHEEAFKSYIRALDVFESLYPLDGKIANGIGLTSNNLSALYYNTDKSDSANFYAQKSLKFLEGSHYYSLPLSLLGLTLIDKGESKAGLDSLSSSYEIALSIGNKIQVAASLSSLAVGYEKIGNIDKAIEFHEKAVIASSEISGSNKDLVENYYALVELYLRKGNDRKAQEYRALHQAAKDSLINLETVKAHNKLLFEYEITKKEQEIALLTKDNEIQKVNEEKQKLVQNITVFGFSLMLVFAVVFFVQRNKIKKGKKLSDRLLYNILPTEVAEELKEKGESIAKHFEDASVLFSDFKGFTSISERLTAQELVAEINTCFKAFDKIITLYGMEKIKTIGDAYMAAGGLHIPKTSTTKDVVLAALEMQEFIKVRKENLRSEGKQFFEMRVGVHTGPVVAGIVGTKKFQYDIWGDTVNTANRIESNGEVGRINISEHTYKLIKDDQQFTFEKRGKINVKGKGDLEMYFVALAS